MSAEELNNIFKNLPANLNEEFFEQILTTENFVVERIISDGHASQKDFWYDQTKNEFVILISGSAQIQYDDGNMISLNPGDYLIIPAHKKHRVESTDKNEKTFWLAIHY